MLISLYEMLYSVEALPKTWSPIKLAKRSIVKAEIMERIHAELDLRISQKI